MKRAFGADDAPQFYSEAILSRRGPLAKVWLAAHMERKLSKTQTLQTDIEQSARAFLSVSKYPFYRASLCIGCR